MLPMKTEYNQINAIWRIYLNVKIKLIEICKEWFVKPSMHNIHM